MSWRSIPLSVSEGTPVICPIRRFLIIEKLENHDICAPIFGMGRVMTIQRCIRILFETTANLHNLPRTVLLAPLLDQVNCVRG
jgi:hypothetical protein